MKRCDNMKQALRKNICGGPMELSLEEPSGEDNCLDTQWGFCGPNAQFKMKGGRDRTSLKWWPIFEAQSGTQLIHGLEWKRRQQ